MKPQLSKIVLFLLIAGFLSSCNTIKRVAEDEHLLTKTTIEVNEKVDYSETINNLLYQHPNRKFARIPLRLHIYNLARPNIDSILDEKIYNNPRKVAWKTKLLSKKQLDRDVETRKNFNNWLKKTGEAPVIFDETKSEKSINRIKSYYFNHGWFNVEATYDVEKFDNQRAEVTYHVKTGTPYVLDSIRAKISTPVLDSLYQKIKRKSLLKQGEQFLTENLIAERERLTTDFRNSGVYHFSSDYITFVNDTIGTGHKVNIDVEIPNRSIKVQDGFITRPFKVYKIKDVNIYTDHSFENIGAAVSDSVDYKSYKLYSYGKMRYKAKALTDAIFIAPGDVFRDIARTRSYRHLSELHTFNYPDIEYIENPDTTLTANIYLSPKKKFGLGFSAEVSQSNIQSVGFSANPSLIIRNIFRGAETFEISARGAIGASKDAANDRDEFFDINELGVDLRLTIPRLFSPFNTDKIIPKYMFPSTRISLAATGQTNIGLDKQTLTAIFNYKWNPSNKVTNRLDLLNIRYVRNLNTDNYFGIYTNSYNTLNNIAQDVNYIGDDESLGYPMGTDAFIGQVLGGTPPAGISQDQIRTVNGIKERQDRLTENNLIVASNFNYVKDRRENLFDENFSIFRVKVESAGNLLSTASQLLGLDKNENDQYELFNVAYSQYIKTELDYIKHWDLGKRNVLAFRSFFGIAIPYGNSTNIPFSKSFFAGGANDNRAWTPYSLGPGTSRSINEFNEANLKLAFSLENRFNLFGDMYGAFFVDVGNIWNALDDVEDEASTFDNLGSLKELAVGSGFGLRYDFSFVVFRFDIGFKTYEPYFETGNRWFRNYNFTHAVYNIGINYPF